MQVDALLSEAQLSEDTLPNPQELFLKQMEICEHSSANDVSGDVMGGEDNRVHLVREGKVEHWDEMSKQEVAMKLVTEIAERLTVDA